MFRTLSTLLLAGLLTNPLASQAKPVANKDPVKVTGTNVEDMLRAMRADLQSTRADVMAKNMTLTAEQAAKFWPMFETYQKEQNVVMDEHLKAIQSYVAAGDTLSDAAATAFMDAHLRRDTRMNELRQKWSLEFRKVLPPRLAARAMQIDRRLSLVTQLEISSQIPLIH